MTLKNVEVDNDTINSINEYVEMRRACGEKKISVKSVLEDLIRSSSKQLGKEVDGFHFSPPELVTKIAFGLRASVAVIGRDGNGQLYPSVVYLGAFGWCDDGDFGKKLDITAWKHKTSVPPPPPGA